MHSPGRETSALPNPSPPVSERAASPQASGAKAPAWDQQKWMQISGFSKPVPPELQAKSNAAFLSLRRELDPGPRMFSSRTFMQGLQQPARGVPHGQIDVKQSWSPRGAVARMGESWQLSTTQPRTGRKADKPSKILLGGWGRTAAWLSEEGPETHLCAGWDSPATTQPEGSPVKGKLRSRGVGWLIRRGEQGYMVPYHPDPLFLPLLHLPQSCLPSPQQQSWC